MARTRYYKASSLGAFIIVNGVLGVDYEVAMSGDNGG